MARALALAIAVAAAGCGLGDGTGSLAGTLYMRGCTSKSDYGALGAPATFDMRPAYFVADPINAPTSAKPLHPVNKLWVRVQATGNREEEADLLLLSVADVAEAGRALGTPIAVGPTSNVRAALRLQQTCPRGEVEAELDGMVTFSRFGAAQAGAPPGDLRIEFGDPLSATFSFDLTDRRALTLGGQGSVPTEAAVGGHVAGSFDFIVRQGKAAQVF